MPIKKTAIIAVFISAIFVGASFMVARAYEPLVRIPGLPTTGDINLSQYVVGLYHFLLSVVGIVAVMMLIIGGMKYITAAGNAATVADAKDTISNAIFGLLLALLSWVIVSAINPDVLYIKNPTSSFTDPFVTDLSLCGVYDGTVPSCECRDGSFIIPVPVDQDACDIACREDHCGLTKPLPCIKGGLFSGDPFTREGVETCHCVDGEFVKLSAAAIAADAGCNEVCSNPAYANPNEYHGINWNLKVGQSLGGLSLIEKTTVPINEVIYHDLSGVRDCHKDGTVHLAIQYGGSATGLDYSLPIRFCCLPENRPPGLGCLSWAATCSIPGVAECEEVPHTYVPPVPPNETEYPIWENTYTVGGLNRVWVGVSRIDETGSCFDYARVFLIDVQ